MCLSPPRPLDSPDTFLPVGSTFTFNQPTLSPDLPILPELIVISGAFPFTGLEVKSPHANVKTVFVLLSWASRPSSLP